jgi:CelD/BcsL family acetyltransferase involved in cellulose biosynthesis
MPKASELRFQLEVATDVDALGMRWRALEATGDPSFFLSWHWIGTWLTAIKGMPLLLSGTAGGRIVLLALLTPLRRHDLGVLPIRAARLHETGDSATDVITIEYNGFLVARDWHPLASSAAIQFLFKSGFDELQMRGVPADYDTVFRREAIVSVVDRKPSWRVDLDAVRGSGEPYLSHISANTRQQVRRSMRLYQARGELCLTRARNVDEALEHLAGLRCLHQHYWESRGQPGAFSYPFFEEFHRRLISDGIRGNFVELIKVACGKDAVGYLYNFLYRGKVLSYQSGFSYEVDSKIKPGLVSHCLCIDSHIALGASVYDFMAGESRYKASLGQSGPDMLHIVAQKPAVSIKLANAGRRLAKAIVRGGVRVAGRAAETCRAVTVLAARRR